MEILARAVGRRKEAVAQVQLVRGNGQFSINDKPAQAYLQNNSCSLICIKSPLETALSLSLNNLVNAQSTDTVVNEKKEEQSTRIVQTEQSGILNNPEGGVDANLINGSVSYGEAKSETTFSTLSGAPLEQQGLNDSKQLAFTSIVSNVVTHLDEIDIIIKVKGGGLIGQAEAIKLGIARAFCIIENTLPGGILRKTLKTKGYLTQDSRVKERRKYGLKKARKASQYHKR